MSPPWFTPALIGVTRLPEVPFEGDIGAELGRLVAGENDLALAFSRFAGAAAACRRAAVALASVPTDILPPASHDPSALPSAHRWMPALEIALGSASARLQHEALTRLAAASASLPAALLPTALDLGRRSQAIRPALAAVLGQRGQWLARLNPDWRFAAAGPIPKSADLQAWDEGSFEQRIAYFQALRAADPAAAAALLQRHAGELSAKERVAFIQLLANRLSASDEAVLAPLLKDRSREVRLAAAMLLALLPDSEHARRLADWIAPLIVHKRGLLKAKWECDAPAEADPTWPAAAIETKRPQYEALGERAWWLYQLVRQISLDWWTAQTGMTPAELVRWANGTDWTAALYRGWRERVDGQHPDWVDALLDGGQQATGHDRAALLRLLPVPLRERHWPRSVEALGNSGLLGDIVESCPLGETLSPAFSQALVEDLHRFLAADRLRHDYHWRASALELVCVVHAGALRAWQPVPRRDDEPPALAECLDDLERRVAARRVLHDF